MNNNIQGWGRILGGAWERSNQEFFALVDRPRVMFSNKQIPVEFTITR